MDLSVGQADEEVNLIYPSHETPFLVKFIQVFIHLFGGSDSLKCCFASISPHFEEGLLLLQLILSLIVTKSAVKWLSLLVMYEPCLHALFKQISHVVFVRPLVPHPLGVHQLRHLSELQEALLDFPNSELFSQPQHSFLL